MATKTKTGMRDDLSNEAYHAAPGISKSMLDVAARSAMHYHARFVAAERLPHEPTPAMRLGTAVHAAVLEPERFAAAYFAAPAGIDRRTTAGKAAWAQAIADNVGREMLAAEDYAICMEISSAIRRHPIAGGLLKDGMAERSFFAKDTETGVIRKCRPDWITDGGIVLDVKTTDDASPAAFGRSAANFRYDVQAAWYLDTMGMAVGNRPEHFVFIACEKTPPYAIGVYFIQPEHIETGREKARRDLARIVECQAAGAWPDYGNEVMPLLMPAWSQVVTP